MGNKFIQDPWARITTRNGLPGDEVISSLQKCIRRGMVEEACRSEERRVGKECRL